MKCKFLIASALFCISAYASAGELGVGLNGPSVAPSEPTETDSSSENYWQELLEWFETDDDGE